MNNLYTVNTLNANDQVVIWQGENSNFAAIPQAEFLQGVKDQIDFTMLENQIGDVRNDVSDLTDRVDLISTHNELNGRSANDAHPISSISGLQSALDNRVSLGADDQTIAGTKSFNVLNAVNGSGIKNINADNIAIGTVPSDRLPKATMAEKGALEVATADEVRAISSNELALTPLNFGQTALGWGQTYKNVTTERVIGATYTNNTGRPILFIVRAQSFGDTFAQAKIYVGVLVVADAVTRFTANEKVACVSAIIPSGATYKYDGSAQGGGVFTIIELA